MKALFIFTAIGAIISIMGMLLDNDGNLLKGIGGVVLGICLVISIVMAVKQGAPAQETLYPMTAQVVELDRENDIVTCADGAGLLWEFTECDDWQTGDFVSLLMNDGGTPQTIYDDTIEMVRYAGTFEG